MVEEALAHTGFGGFGGPTRPKSELTCQFMTANIDARFAYWDTAPPQRELRQHRRPVRPLLSSLRHGAR